MWYRSIIAVSVTLLAACGGARNKSQQFGSSSALGRVTLITSAMISEMSAETALEVVQRRAPQVMLGRPVSTFSRSAVEPPLVVIDGQPAMDVRTLVMIRASDVHSIRILGTIDATSLYGPRASGGVIEVVTKGG